MKVKQLEIDYRLFNILYIGYWNFENNQSINWLLGESAQPHMHNTCVCNTCNGNNILTSNNNKYIHTYITAFTFYIIYT